MNNITSQLSTISSKNVILFLIVIGIISVSIRVYFFPFESPLVTDSLLYFWYANDLSILDEFPKTYDLPNNLWSVVVSFLFEIVESESYLEYMNAQRLLSVTFSVLTIIPMYLLSRRFFDRKISVLSTAFIAFAPRLVLNSLLGITESLFVFLGTILLWLFLSSNKKIIILSFAVAAILSLVRYEGILIIIPMTIIYFVRFRNYSGLKNYFLAITIFMLVLLPMSIVKIDTMGYDGTLSHINSGVIVATEQNSFNEDPTQHQFFLDLAIFSIIKNLLWVLVPTFIIFFPLGIFYLFRNRDYKKNTLILFGVFLIIPELYASGRGIQDFRYMLDLYPILIIISLLVIEKVFRRIRNDKIFFVGIFVTIILMSVIVVENKEQSSYNEEIYKISLETKDVFTVINEHYPEESFRRVTAIDLQGEFPLLREEVDKHVRILSYDDSQNIEEFIKHNRSTGLKHLVIDENPTRPDFIKEVLKDEGKFPYLKKIYDSKERNYEYDYKIFEIDFKEFDRVSP